MPLDVLVANTNFFTKVAALDLAIDETTIPFGGHGDFVYNLMGKKCSRGVQLALLLDVGTMRVRGFFARHRAAPKCEGFTENGPSEVRKLVERFVEGNVGVGKLWERQPHLTVDNHFVDEKIVHWIGERGYGLTGTLSKRILLKDVKNKYLHVEATNGMYILLSSNHVFVVFLLTVFYTVYLYSLFYKYSKRQRHGEGI